MYIEDVVRDYPEAVRPLAESGIVCIRCGEPIWGTIREQAEEKGVTNIDSIIKGLNETYSKH